MRERRRQLAVAALVVALLPNPVRWLLVGPDGGLEPRTDPQQTTGRIMIALSLVLVGLGL